MKLARIGMSIFMIILMLSTVLAQELVKKTEDEELLPGEDRMSYILEETDTGSVIRIWADNSWEWVSVGVSDFFKRLFNPGGREAALNYEDAFSGEVFGRAQCAGELYWSSYSNVCREKYDCGTGCSVRANPQYTTRASCEAANPGCDGSGGTTTTYKTCWTVCSSSGTTTSSQKTSCGGSYPYSSKPSCSSTSGGSTGGTTTGTPFLKVVDFTVDTSASGKKAGDQVKIRALVKNTGTAACSTSSSTRQCSVEVQLFGGEAKKWARGADLSREVELTTRTVSACGGSSEESFVERKLVNIAAGTTGYVTLYVNIPQAGTLLQDRKTTVADPDGRYLITVNAFKGCWGTVSNNWADVPGLPSKQFNCGASCAASPTSSSGSGQCTDSDGGDNAGVKGTVTSGSIIKTDYCGSTSGALYEYFCDGSLANDYGWRRVVPSSGEKCEAGKIGSSGLQTCYVCVGEERWTFERATCNLEGWTSDSSLQCATGKPNIKVTDVIVMTPASSAGAGTTVNVQVNYKNVGTGAADDENTAFGEVQLFGGEAKRSFTRATGLVTSRAATFKDAPICQPIEKGIVDAIQLYLQPGDTIGVLHQVTLPTGTTYLGDGTTVASSGTGEYIINANTYEKCWRSPIDKPSWWDDSQKSISYNCRDDCATGPITGGETTEEMDNCFSNGCSWQGAGATGKCVCEGGVTGGPTQDQICCEPVFWGKSSWKDSCTFLLESQDTSGVSCGELPAGPTTTGPVEQTGSIQQFCIDNGGIFQDGVCLIELVSDPTELEPETVPYNPDATKEECSDQGGIWVGEGAITGMATGVTGCIVQEGVETGGPGGALQDVCCLHPIIDVVDEVGFINYVSHFVNLADEFMSKLFPFFKEQEEKLKTDNKGFKTIEEFHSVQPGSCPKGTDNVNWDYCEAKGLSAMNPTDYDPETMLEVVDETPGIPTEPFVAGESCVPADRPFYSEGRIARHAGLAIIIGGTKVGRVTNSDMDKIDSIIPGFSDKYRIDPETACCGTAKAKYIDTKKETAISSFLGPVWVDATHVSYEIYECKEKFSLKSWLDDMGIEAKWVVYVIAILAIIYILPKLFPRRRRF